MREIMINTERYSMIIAAVGLAAVIAGCARSKPSKFYTLQEVVPESVKVASAENDNHKFIGVGPIEIPGYIDNNKIVTGISGTCELNISEYNRWAEPVGSRIRNVIINNLNELCEPVHVVRYLVTKDIDIANRVVIKINDLIVDNNGKGVIKAEYCIISYGKDGSRTVCNSVRFSETAESSGYNDVVITMSRLLGDLCTDIAGNLSHDK